MSTEYMTEYFAQATLATRGKYNYARRIASDGPEPWRDGGRIWRSDAQMAADGWTPVVESRITLDGLAGAWEAAEVPTEEAPIRKGDVVIEKISDSAYAVMSPPPTCGLVGREFRILSRAPREPWQDLADVLDQYRPAPGELLGWGDDHLAAYLHERGVRVTGGDDGDE